MTAKPKLSTAKKISSPVNNTAGALRDTYKGVDSALVTRKLRDAGNSHAEKQGLFFLTVLATYLHMGKEETATAIRATWADSTHAARQYATNIVRMANVVSEGGKAKDLAGYRTVAELRAEANKVAEANRAAKAAESAAKTTGTGSTPANPEVSISGTDSADPQERFRVSAFAAMQEALASLEIIAREVSAASDSDSVSSDDFLKWGAAILGNVQAMRAKAGAAPAEQPAAGKPAKPAKAAPTKQAQAKKAASAKRRAARPTAADIVPTLAVAEPLPEAVPA